MEEPEGPPESASRPSAALEPEDILLSAVDGLDDFLVVWEWGSRDGQDERVVYANEALTRMTGWPLDAVLGHSPFVLAGVHTDPSSIARIRLRLAAGEPAREELMLHRSDGSAFWVELHAAPVAGGGTSRYVAVGRDVTSRKELEQQLLHAQKMEAVGRLAGGVAHEFNNMLTAILGFSDVLLDEVGPDDPSREDLSLIRESAERASVLTRQLLAFSAKQVLVPRRLDVARLVRSLTNVLTKVVGESVQVEVLSRGARPFVFADPGQLEQVVLNLALHGRDAMPSGGRLLVETHSIVLEGEDAARVALPPGNYVEISVRDYGMPTDPVALKHVFDPFYSDTASVAGMGMPAVYGIVRQSGGGIVPELLPDGTRFRVLLPEAQDVPESNQRRPPRANGRRTETVLVLEDEPIVRRLVRQALERIGCKVLEAEDGVSGLALAAGYAEPIHLLLTDVVMPRMGGRDAARALQHARPELRVVFMSGHTEDHALLQELRREESGFLPKPFTPEALERHVRRALGELARTA